MPQLSTGDRIHTMSYVGGNVLAHQQLLGYKLLAMATRVPINRAWNSGLCYPILVCKHLKLEYMFTRGLRWCDPNYVLHHKVQWCDGSTV